MFNMQNIEYRLCLHASDARNGWKAGCKGLTTFRAAGKRFGILNEVNDNEEPEKAEACFIDPYTGWKSCE